MRMLRVVEVITMRGQSPQQIPLSQPFDRAQGGEQLIQPSGAKQSQLKSEYRNPYQTETSKGRGSGVEGRRNSPRHTRHSFTPRHLSRDTVLIFYCPA